MNHSTNALFFDNVEIPADSLIGEEGKGFSYILDGMNAERILVASDSHRRRALVHREGGRVLEPARRSSASRSAPTRACSSRSPRPTSRPRPRSSCATRRRSSSTPAQPCGGEANMAKYLGRGGGVGGRQRVHRLSRRLRLRRGVRRRAEVPRVPALQDGAGQQQPRARRTSASTCSGCRGATELIGERRRSPRWPPPAARSVR